MGCFAPGRSGNPGGRPPEVGRVKELARAHTEEALGTLVAIMRNGKSPAAARLRAAELLLDRGWGKAETKAEIGAPGEFDHLTPEEVEAQLIEELVAGGIPKEMAEVFARSQGSPRVARAPSGCARSP